MSVRINSPKAFGVIVDGKPVHVPAGLSTVDDAIAAHWYAKAHDVELLDEPKVDMKAAFKTAQKAAKVAADAAAKAVAAAKAKPEDADLAEAAAKAQAEQATAEAVLEGLKLAGAGGDA